MKVKAPEQEPPISLHGLDFETAVRAAMATGKPPKATKPKKLGTKKAKG